MKVRAADFLVYDQETGVYREDPEQVVRDDVEKHYWLHVVRTVAKDWRLYLMLVPMLLVFLFWRYFPMYELLSCFKVYDGVLPVSKQLFSGFSYFKQLLVGGTQLSTDFWRAMRNTFILSFYGLCFGFPMPIILALFFNEVRSNAARSVFQVLTYLPKFMSTVIMTSLVTMLVKQGSSIAGMGVISRALVGLKLISTETGNAGLLNNPSFFRSIYQISGIWEGAGYDSIVFFAAIIAISPTSYEAAQIDGANKWAQMRYVVIPSILSTVVIGAEKGNEIIKEFLETYESRHFVKPDGSFDISTNVEKISLFLQKKFGYPLSSKRFENPEITIYESTYFSPKDYFSGKCRSTKNSYAIHHFDGTWDTKNKSFIKKTAKFIFKISPKFMVFFVVNTFKKRQFKKKMKNYL